MSADYSVASVRFYVHGQVEGSLLLSSSSTRNPVSRLPKTEHGAQLCPDVFYVSPMGPVVANGDVTFSFPSDSGVEYRHLSVSASKGGRGGMVRGWSDKPWPTFMNDAYYLGSVFAQHKPGVVARLYDNNELLCAANQMLDPSLEKEKKQKSETPEVRHDSVWATKVFPDSDQGKPRGLAGTFRDTRAHSLVRKDKPQNRDQDNKNPDLGLDYYMLNALLTLVLLLG